MPADIKSALPLILRGRSARPNGSLRRSVPRTPVRPQCMHGVQGGAGKARGGAPPHARRGPAHRRASPSCRSCCVRPKRAYSITLSARATNIAGTVTPIALAVLRLTRPTRGSQTAHQGRGAADGGELRQAAEAVKGQANAILFRNSPPWPGAGHVRTAYGLLPRSTGAPQPCPQADGAAD